MGKVTERNRPQIGIATTVGSVDATVITSPAEFAAEKHGLRVIMPAREPGELVRIPITGIDATQKDGKRSH